MADSIFPVLQAINSPISLREIMHFTSQKLKGKWKFFDLAELDFLNGEAAFEIIRKSDCWEKENSANPEVDPRLGE